MLFYKDKRIAELEKEIVIMAEQNEIISDHLSEALLMLDEKDEMIADLESHIVDMEQDQPDYSVPLRRIRNILKDIEL